MQSATDLQHWCTRLAQPIHVTSHPFGESRRSYSHAQHVHPHARCGRLTGLLNALQGCCSPQCPLLTVCSAANGAHAHACSSCSQYCSLLPAMQHTSGLWRRTHRRLVQGRGTHLAACRLPLAARSLRLPCLDNSAWWYCGDCKHVHGDCEHGRGGRVFGREIYKINTKCCSVSEDYAAVCKAVRPLRPKLSRHHSQSGHD